MSVKPTSYVSIQAFMVNDLHLSGNELIIFAVIFGYSQDGEHWFHGSRQHLADWCQASKTTVSNNLDKLIAKGLIEKRTRIDNGVTFNDYRAVPNITDGYKKIEQGVQESCRPPIQETCTHTIEIDNASTYNNDIIDPPKERKPQSIEVVRAYFREKGYTSNPDEFFYHYEMTGWTQNSGRAIKSWHAAADKWDIRNKQWSKGRNNNTQQVPHEMSEVEKQNQANMQQYFSFAG